MKKLHITMLLVLSLVFILGCSLFTGTPATEAPAAPAQPANEEPSPQQSAPTEKPAQDTPAQEPTTPPMPQSGDLIFQTNFPDIDDWEVITKDDVSNYNTEIRGDGLFVEVPNDNDYWYAYAPMDYNYEDVRVEADVELVGGTNYTYITLTCRSSQDGEYVFFLDTGGYWQIGKYVYGDDSRYERLADGGSTKINVARHPNHISAVCKGKTLTMSVNGEKIGSVEDSHFTTGIVGIGVETLDYPLSQVIFHNLEVYIP
jgi:hypothetical protein